VIDDANITDAGNFGWPAAIVAGGSLVSLDFTFPVNGLSFSLPDFNIQQVVSAAGWTASAGVLTNVFDFVGNDLNPLNQGIQSVRVQSGGTNGLNDLVFTDPGLGTNEAHTGQWVLVPEPSTALLVGLGLTVLASRRQRS
jgi:hypothetical protein